MSTKTSVGLLACVALALCLAACARVNSGVGGALNFDTDLHLVLDVADDINPDESHRPSPVYIRLYELRSDKLFSQSDFLELFQDDKAVLGDDLIAKQELRRVVPGESRAERFVLNPQTRYVALFAEFYQYKNSRSKAIFAVTPSNVIENHAQLRLERNSLTLRSLR